MSIDAATIRELIFDLLIEPVDLLGSLELNKHDTGLSMVNGVIKIEVDDKVYEVKVVEIA